MKIVPTMLRIIYLIKEKTAYPPDLSSKSETESEFSNSDSSSSSTSPETKKTHLSRFIVSLEDD